MKSKIKSDRDLVSNNVFAILGMVVEWCDFYLYVLLSPVLIKLFFYQLPTQEAEMIIMLIYFITCVARFLGGIFLGSWADKFGRKDVFVKSSVLMSISSLIMAAIPIIPNATSISIVILLLVRIMQGFSQGGETPLGFVFVYEHCKNKDLLFYLILLSSAVSVGCLISIGIVNIIHHLCSSTQYVLFGWRIAYLSVSALGFFVYHIRANATETEDFLQVTIKSDIKPISLIFKRYANIIFLFCFICIPYSGFAEFASMSNILFIRYVNYSPEEILMCCLYVNCLIIVLKICIATILKRSSMVLYSMKFYCVAMFFYMIAVIVCNFFLYNLYHHYDWFFILARSFCDACMPMCYILAMLIIMPLFPTKVRASGFSAGYNMGILMSGICPVVNTWLISHAYDTYDLYILNSMLMLFPIGLVSYLFYKRKHLMLSLDI